MYYYIEICYVFYTGILAGIWPCGVITLLAELFVSESKAQVYGALHDYLCTNMAATNDISKFCHIWVSTYCDHSLT